MKYMTLNLAVLAYTSKKRGIMPILTLMSPTTAPPPLPPAQIYRFHVKYQPLLLNKPPPIWNKIWKSSKTGQEKKSLISTFVWFLIAIAKV